MLRLFVALDLPDAVREALSSLIAQLKPKCRNARWVKPEGMHVTLKFIGEVEHEKVGPIRAKLETIRSNQPVELNFRGLGFFPNEQRIRVVWCGVEASDNLAPLAAAVGQALLPLGILAEAREFVPHLTLARFSSPNESDDLAQAAAKFSDYEFGRARAEKFHLYQSTLKPAGAEYARLAPYSFVKEPA